MKSLILLFFSLGVFFMGQQVSAQQLKYTPVNPNFGGNYLNYNWLLASANAQDPFKDTNKSNQGSLLDNFSDSMKRQLLNQLSRDLLNGEGGLAQPGTHEEGGLIIDVDNTRAGTIITIIDPETGESTQIII